MNKKEILFLFAVASPVFRLLGKMDLGTPGNYLTDPLPPVDIAVLDGEPAWRQHDGGHTDAPNWPAFLQWAAKYIHVAKPQSALPKQG